MVKGSGRFRDSVSALETYLSPILVMVCLYEAMPRTVGDIGSTVGMDTGTLTPLLKRLVSAGLVTRERDTKDERRVLVGLTPAAEAMREAVLGIPAMINTACRLSEKDAADLRNTLNGLAHSPTSKTDEEKGLATNK